MNVWTLDSRGIDTANIFSFLMVFTLTIGSVMA